jgi:MHS family proline/betaine transporter-like MFS transporter
MEIRWQNDVVVPKSPHFKAHEAGTPSSSPFCQVWSQNRKEMGQACLFAATYGMVFYLVMVYLPGWLSREAGMDEATALQINSARILLIIPFMVAFAWVGDRWIRRTRLIAISMVLTALVAWPVGKMMVGDSVPAMVFSQAVLVLLLAVPLGSAPAVFVELFPSEDRLTGYSISFNLGVGVVGGATPMLATWLIGITGQTMAPGWMMVAAAILAAVALLIMQDRSRERLR